MLARRDTRLEAARLRRLSPLQTFEDQSQTWGIRCHSCTGREGLAPSWKLSYKTYVLRFTRESKFSFNQRIARSLSSRRASARWRYGLGLTTCWSPASADLQGLHTSLPFSRGTSAAPARRWLPRRFGSRGRQSGGAVAPAQTPACPCADAPGTRGCGTGSVRPYAPGTRSRSVWRGAC